MVAGATISSVVLDVLVRPRLSNPVHPPTGHDRGTVVPPLGDVVDRRLVDRLSWFCR
jgi:hypothetical protein